MTSDDDTLARIRALLAGSPRIDAARIEVVRDGAQVVLRGAVSTPEEASVAAMVVEGRAGDVLGSTGDSGEALTVRNELRVDAGLREATSEAEPAEAARPPAAAGDTPGGEDVPTDLTADAHEALDKNVPWDPPEAPSFAPTRGEELGRPVRASSMPPPARPGTVDNADEEDPSASDLSAAELERTARPTDPDDKDR